MPDWLKEWWPVVVFAVPMVYGWILWAANKGLASKEDVRAEASARDLALRQLETDIGKQVEAIDRRTVKIEADLEHLPTSQDVAELRQEMARIAGSMEGSQRELLSIGRAVTRMEDRMMKGNHI